MNTSEVHQVYRQLIEESERLEAVDNAIGAVGDALKEEPHYSETWSKDHLQAAREELEEARAHITGDILDQAVAEVEEL